MIIDKEVNPRFNKFLFDWDYEQYLLLGAYGSSKSYHVALKIILKCLKEKRKVLVIREVYATIRDSCYDLFTEIIDEMDLDSRVSTYISPLRIKFSNGSVIIFNGMDKPKKLKSINGVSIVWLEECSEIKYEGYKELLGRLRTPDQSLHFIMSTNPVDIENWVYTHFFKRIDESGKETVILDDNRLYEKKTIVKNGIYYHHSVTEDNKFLPVSYIKRLDEMQTYDPDLYRVARLGQFGVSGTRVLPQFTVTETHQEVMERVSKIPKKHRFTGMDFGFEVSYNAVIRTAVDDMEKILYIYWEYYKNQMTDDITAKELKEQGLQGELIIADCEDPKAITFYNQSGFRMIGCTKFAGSRLSNIKKIKRFKKIVCSPECINTIRELRTLVYKKDVNGKTIYDEFNIDPHTFSAIWYGLDKYYVADIKEQKNNSIRGGD